MMQIMWARASICILFITIFIAPRPSLPFLIRMGGGRWGTKSFLPKNQVENRLYLSMPSSQSSETPSGGDNDDISKKSKKSSTGFGKPVERRKGGKKKNKGGALESSEDEEVKSSEADEVRSSEDVGVKSTEDEEVKKSEVEEVKKSEDEVRSEAEIVSSKVEEVKSSESEEVIRSETEEVKSSKTKEEKSSEAEEVQSSESEEVKSSETEEAKSSETEEVKSSETEEVKSSETKEVKSSETEEGKRNDAEEVKSSQTEEVKSSEAEEVQISEDEEAKSSEEEEEFIPTPNKDILPKIASEVVTAMDGKQVELGNFVKKSSEDKGKKTTVLACLSHFGDYNAWEVTQQYIAALEDDFDSDCEIILVGIGSAESAAKFADDVGLNEDNQKRIKLVSDETGSVSAALGCYRGWLKIDKEHAERWPESDVNPYVKLLGMIFGFGSPGTIGRVLVGYLGDKKGGPRSRKWVIDALLYGSEKGRFPKIGHDAFSNVPPDSGLRPFELATLRAQTGIHIVSNWGKLGPKDGDLFICMGGTFVFKDEICIYEYYDKGILTYAPINEVIKAANFDML